MNYKQIGKKKNNSFKFSLQRADIMSVWIVFEGIARILIQNTSHKCVHEKKTNKPKQQQSFIYFECSKIYLH